MTIRAYCQPEQAKIWRSQHQHQQPTFACVLGFTDTGLLSGISAAGATPEDRQFTAIADAEFLSLGHNPNFPLPPLMAGASPVLIARAVIAGLGLPHHLFNAGLRHAPTVPTIDLGGQPANCLSSGAALPIEVVWHLWQQGLAWGKKLGQQLVNEPGKMGRYLIVGECVVGGTTTALAVLTALGLEAQGMVNSSHPNCNHAQKWQLVEAGLGQANRQKLLADPIAIVAAVGDPMQIVVAGMAIAASNFGGVMLAGGTQMLAIYALMQALAQTYQLAWQPTQIVVGTTRWVAEDPTGDTVGLAQAIGDVPLLATQLSFADSKYPQLRAYEQGFVKEGVGAGGLAIAATLYQNWSQSELLTSIETQLASLLSNQSST
ncbi:UPF0284 protein [Thalassoporum mexicanum PCC 7367]|uniref:nicotinate mononucleotide-dependent phosphoribosyltransferase CobT n=1 Tax=Thalassoporum mexicanum TaxID=3457544 RepID=UPI00029FBFA3|nr:TIGR00303 family protein [Pseudanabaena sp. PCC 7367]AFY71388.1 UPF0284 protein [Pseudanabaena sp. PCC 7367]